MEGGESPLDVLSRAATMVQENQALSEESKQACKQTTKWKRDRRSRLPEYSRKSDPKIQETFGTDAQQRSSSPESAAPCINGHGDVPQELVQRGQNGTDAPLDMSVRQRGLPPSYSQTVNNPGYRSSYRPSVIQNGPPPPREELPSGISMCDPIIDEHFRRSLGKKYHTLFGNNNVPKEPPPEVEAPPKSVANPANVIELMDSTGLSVDDHFAKALGDTWIKLNKKDNEIKSTTSESNLLSI